MTTPAQTHGHPTFVESFGPGGPTDQSQREASCVWASKLPLRASCCGGPLPAWLVGRSERLFREGVEIDYSGLV